MKRLLVWLMIFLCCGVAWAASTTTNYSLYKPAVGDKNWGSQVNQNFDTIDTQMKANADASALNTSHRTDNTQAHSDYLLNNQSDSTTGTITAGGFIGDLTGNADTSTYSQAVNWTAVEALSPINSAAVNWDSIEVAAPITEAMINDLDDYLIIVQSGDVNWDDVEVNSPILVDMTIDWNTLVEADLTGINWDYYAGGGATITGTNTQVLFFDEDDTPAGNAGLTYNKVTGILTSTAGFSSGGSPTLTAGAVQWNAGDYIDGDAINWDTFDGLIKSSNINWANIEVIAPINGASINWTDLETLSRINGAAINWTDLEVVARINNAAINWADMTDLTTSGAVVWGNIAEGELADSTVISEDIKDGTITAADTAITAGRSLTWSTNDLVADAELYTDTKCVYILAPVATDDLKSIWYAKGATTITSLWCESDQTVTAMLQVDDGSPADVDNTDLTCDSTPTEDTSLDGDATLAAGDRLDLDIASVSGTPTWVSICWTATYDD